MITSRQNPIVARYRAAARGDDSSVVLLDGVHLVADALAAGIALHEVVVAAAAEARADIAALVEALRRADVPFVSASAPVMAAISPVRAGRVYGSVPLVAIAADVQDPGNVGAIVRVAEAAGATGLVAAGISADPFGWKALRGSMGSALRLPILPAADAADAIADARRHGCRIVATAPRGGRPLFDVDFRGAVAVVVGGEGAGLPAPLVEAADERATIPMQAPVESLNAAVTAALVLYEARRQRS